jgi:hypothetical protein
MIAGLNIKLDEIIWGDVLHRYGLPGRIVAGVLRNLYAVLRDIFSGQLTLRAMSLVYTTLLSVVPLVAVSFAVLKGFGVDEDLEQYLYGLLEPLGDKGIEITGQVMNLVDNVHGGVIGGIGLAFFIYTAISMVQKIEESFNYVWYVSKPRSFATRFVEYSAVLIIGSLAITLALRTIASLGEEGGDHRDLHLSLQVHAEHQCEIPVRPAWWGRWRFPVGVSQHALWRVRHELLRQAGHLCQFRHRDHGIDLALPELADTTDRVTTRVLLPESGVHENRAP